MNVTVYFHIEFIFVKLCLVEERWMFFKKFYLIFVGFQSSVWFWRKNVKINCPMYVKTSFFTSCYQSGLFFFIFYFLLLIVPCLWVSIIFQGIFFSSLPPMSVNSFFDVSMGISAQMNWTCSNILVNIQCGYASSGGGEREIMTEPSSNAQVLSGLYI